MIYELIHKMGAKTSKKKFLSRKDDKIIKEYQNVRRTIYNILAEPIEPNWNRWKRREKHPY